MRQTFLNFSTPLLLAPAYKLSVSLLTIFLPILEKEIYLTVQAYPLTFSLASFLFIFCKIFLITNILFDYSSNAGISSQEECICFTSR